MHIEVQNQGERNFSERMYIYHHRIFERYVGSSESPNKVVSFAILCFPDKKDQSCSYESEFWGNKLTFTFPVIKITDYRARWDELEHSQNLFAVVVMAHLKAADVTDDQERKYWKFKLMKSLYQRGLARTQIIELFKFIDWLIVLPEALSRQFWSEIYALEEEKSMPYITSVEQIGIKKGLGQGIAQGLGQGIAQGIEQGLQQGIIEILEDKFGAMSTSQAQEIEAITDLQILKKLIKLAASSTSLVQFVKMLRSD